MPVQQNRFRLGHLSGGGLILGYRCQSKCQHCLYGCGPHRLDGKPTIDELMGILDLLEETAPTARYHLGGGEPFLDVALLATAILEMHNRRLLLDYVETNAGWATNEEHARETFSELAAWGLKCVLVSVSPFHAQHIPFEKTKAGSGHLSR